MFNLRGFISSLWGTPRVQPEKRKGQKSISFSPARWTTELVGYSAEYWRKLVERSAIASTCQAILIERLTALDFRIVPREVDFYQVQDEVAYYERLFSVGGGLGSLQALVQTVAYDLLTSPSGATLEIIRNGELPVALVPVDASTVHRTGNPEYPIEQIVNGESVRFSAEKVVNAVYMERSFFSSNGYGVTPPMIARNAILAMSAIETYLQDVANKRPVPGILNLGDVTREGARRWIEELVEDLKRAEEEGRTVIPVLYESSGAQFIRLAEPLDAPSLREALNHLVSIIVSAYGLTPADLRGNTSDSLSGSIRSERYSKRTGEGALRRILETMFNSILPEYLKFKFMDVYDEEQRAVNQRAFLSAVMALERAVVTQIVTPEVARAFLESNFGFNFATEVPTEEPPEKLPRSEAKGVSGGVKTAVGERKPTMQGGFGEVRFRPDFTHLRSSVYEYTDLRFGNLWKNRCLQGTILWSLLYNPADILALRQKLSLEESTVKDLIRTLI